MNKRTRTIIDYLFASNFGWGFLITTLIFVAFFESSPSKIKGNRTMKNVSLKKFQWIMQQRSQNNAVDNYVLFLILFENSPFLIV